MTQRTPRTATLRRTGLVVLDGGDRLTTTLARLLGDMGLRLEVGSDAADAADLALRAGETEAVPDAVVLAGTDRTRSPRWTTWRALGIPHLPLDWDRSRVTVGPVVVPGSPCLKCLDLHRHDVRRLGHARLVGPDRSGRHADGPDGVLTALGAGLAALMVRNLILHRQYLPGVSLEVTLPDPCIAPRRWEQHPRCDGHGGHATIGL